MSDLIKREDALECFMGFDRMGDVKDAIAALPAVVPSVKPLVWLQQYNAIGEPTNFWQAADPVLNVCWHANPTRPKEVVEATRSDRILAVLELVAAPDPAAIREAALQARIEELGGSLAWYQMMDAMSSDHVVELTDKLEAAEAKLTKAVETLQILKPLLGDSWVDRRVLAVLADLEGK